MEMETNIENIKEDIGKLDNIHEDINIINNDLKIILFRIKVQKILMVIASIVGSLIGSYLAVHF